MNSIQCWSHLLFNVHNSIRHRMRFVISAICINLLVIIYFLFYYYACYVCKNDNHLHIALFYICFWSIIILFLSNKSCDNLRFWKLGNKTHVAAVYHAHASISTMLCGAGVLSKYIYGVKHV